MFKIYQYFNNYIAIEMFYTNYESIILSTISALIFEKINDDHQNVILALRKATEHEIIFLRKEVIHRQLPLPMPCYASL